MRLIRLYDPRSGLHQDKESRTLTPKLVVMQFDNRHTYDREYELEAQLSKASRSITVEPNKLCRSRRRAICS